MPELTISEVARQIGIRASAIRYYERIGILPSAKRVSGQRRYNHAALYRLALIQQATGTGFTLDEIRELFFGFGEDTPASKRWRKMSQKKLAELEAQRKRIASMTRLLRRVMQCCECQALEQCGRAIFQKSRKKSSVGKNTNVRTNSVRLRRNRNQWRHEKKISKNDWHGTGRSS